MSSPEAIFIRVVEAGGFKQAAQQLNMEPSTVSRKVAKLEQRLKAKLLNRSTAQTTPTELGKAYYQGLRRLLNEQDALEEEIFSNSKDIKGHLRIATTVDLGDTFIAPIVEQMLKLAPELSVELILGADIADLPRSNIDVAIRLGRIEDSEMYAKYLGEIPRVLTASPEYLKAHGTPKKISDLAQHHFVLYSQLQAKSDIQFQDGSHFPAVKIRSAIMANSLKSIAYFVKSGLGVNWGPRWLYEQDLQEGKLIELLPATPTENFTVTALYTTRQFLPYRVRWFLELLGERLELG
ncbi:LysR family transcriptional regulator [Hahella sp. KA22]|uniref:LysR family transcriptional regulator n=1 Tax=Hahella sp. KA22 TaxID=1628392 RepID=UPI000FDE967B|nr:LysR family transcriptional regulator [Hahella sp. KA22]AZZ92525.1 LysR family transcriptional regulator [Hahella sp. KA22]QAY55898.1 LysR family transcriptional regulator [Hahella sp. KA22]